MKLACLFSGGKDSCLALHKAARDNEIKYLLNVNPKTRDSWMFHKPDLKLLKKQARMLNIPLIIQESKGEKEAELADLEKIIKKVRDKIEGIVIGGIKSNYQGERLKKICKKLNLELVAPLWGYSVEQLWNELLDENFKIVMTKISCEGIDKGWIGKIINKENFRKLEELYKKYKFRLDFEGGEAETAVLAMPGMKEEIKLEFDVVSEDKYRHFIKIKEIL